MITLKTNKLTIDNIKQLKNYEHYVPAVNYVIHNGYYYTIDQRYDKLNDKMFYQVNNTKGGYYCIDDIKLAKHICLFRVIWHLKKLNKKIR